MDFGLGKYLEMFGERFGKRAATVLLCLITLALTSLCVDIIYHKLFLPIYKAILSITGNHSLYELLKHDLISILLSTAVLFILSSIIWHAISGHFIRRAKNVIAEAEAILKYAHTEYDEIVANARLHTEKAKSKANALIEHLEALDQKIKDAINKKGDN